MKDTGPRRIHAKPLTAGCVLALASITALGLGAPAASAAPAGRGVTVTSHFVVTDDADVTGDSAYLNNGATNVQPGDLVYMQLNDTPGGVCGCAIVTKPLGVWYDASMSEWAVFNEDASSMTSAPSFNILVVPKASRSAFVQHASGSNTQGAHTFINSRLLNGNPRAVMQVTQVFNPGGTLAGTFNPHAVGVRYYPRAKKWAIVNEDGAKMPSGAAFNVLIGSSASNGGKTALAVDTAFDHKIGTLIFSTPWSNDNPNNVTFATANFNPNGKGGTIDKHPTEVALPNPGSGIFNETLDSSDFTNIPLKAAFNLLIFTS